MSQKLIGEFHKNSVELVKVHIQEWRGQPYFDVRVWYSENPGENRAERPTHKGLTLNADLLPQFISALQEAQDILEKEEK